MIVDGNAGIEIKEIDHCNNMIHPAPQARRGCRGTEMGMAGALIMR
ncbi:hypothetical protein SAMN05443144_11287 [Fodinibius roseus]|uniref:Uncharacterized protein n=1 Tax=Fodinibius roseus TaxID=1194090 RepID=A0A1M5E0N8_9BACT|nr:hypothetical protein [Fodinibius roseus]SHF72621.1 hypothetical protein SAMN05443144_11287 [Fodinibius roseus]